MTLAASHHRWVERGSKAGAAVNLLRWTSPRTVKETFVPPTSVGYPFMGEE